MGEFLKHQLPDPVAYFEGEGLFLQPGGKWRTTECRFHGGSDSMRVNIESGAWICMSCNAKGGDVLAHHRAAHGMGFVEAARALGAYVDGGEPHKGSTRPSQPPARALLQLCSDDLMLCAMILADSLNGSLADADYDDFRAAAGRVIHLSKVAHV